MLAFPELDNDRYTTVMATKHSATLANMPRDILLRIVAHLLTPKMRSRRIDEVYEVDQQRYYRGQLQQSDIEHLALIRPCAGIALDKLSEVRCSLNRCSSR